MSAIEYAVTNPATGETLKTFDTISDDALKAAIGRAHDARQQLGARHERRGAGEGHRPGRRAAHGAPRRSSRRSSRARWASRSSRPLGEVDFSAAIYQYYADNAVKLLADEPIDLLDGEGSAFIRRSPVGLLLGIMPWNYPYYQVARFAGPNLVTGNTILLKHAPQCPESAAAMEEIFHDAGVPKDAYINIYATNEQIEWVIGDPRVQGVSLTGSGRAGAAVAQIAGRHLKKVVLELGGSDPFIVLAADDLDAVVEQAVGGRLENTGQACNAAKRFIVVDELYDAVRREVHRRADRGRAGRPVVGGHGDRPAVVDRRRRTGWRRRSSRRSTPAPRSSPAAAARATSSRPPSSPTSRRTTRPTREEFFGPVAQVYKVGSEAEAIELANDTPYGLGSYVFTSDEEQALRVADQIEAGMVFINVVGAEGVELPFGGVKASGFGRELGRFGADEFVNKKLIRVG